MSRPFPGLESEKTALGRLWFWGLLGFTEGLQVDAELLAFLVEVTAFQAQDARHIGHMEIVAANFSQEHFPFKRLGPFDKCSRTRAA